MLSTLRPLGPDDVAASAAIDRESSPSPWSEAQFRAELDKPFARSWVAVAGGDVLGFGVLWLIADEGQVANLAVHPAHRRRGEGGRILGRLIDDARAARARRLTLDVREGNLGARSLYDRAGFHLVGRRPRFYEGRETALLLDLNLSPPPTVLS